MSIVSNLESSCWKMYFFVYNFDRVTFKLVVMKKKMIVMAIVIVVIVGLLAYYQYVPFWASLVSTGAFLFGTFLGWIARGWTDKHIS